MAFDASASDRLKEERKRLGWTQQDAAAKCETDQTQWSRYERNATAPGGEVLGALAANGGDVHYVLTGIKGNAKPTPEEQALLHYFRALGAHARANLICMSGVMSMNPPLDDPKAVAMDMPRALRLLGLFLTCAENDQAAIEIVMDNIMAHQRGE
jgi:transcriptional regulator with XRE-family HTH domain